MPIGARSPRADMTVAAERVGGGVGAPPGPRTGGGPTNRAGAVLMGFGMRTRKHHLPVDVFTNERRFVSLTCCTSNRWPVFLDPVAAAQVVRALFGTHGDDQRVLAYCVMPDHVHTVVALNRRPPGVFVQAVKSIASRNIRTTEKAPALWQRGYFDHVIRRREECGTASYDARVRRAPTWRTTTVARV
jgi:REP element-mobilizing transposase RayT